MNEKEKQEADKEKKEREQKENKYKHLRMYKGIQHQRYGHLDQEFVDKIDYFVQFNWVSEEQLPDHEI